ncbi:MAG: transketolase [Oscillospiraceae bacterium]|nr:transketolase [Oscillospiraceae bacterium]
MNRKVIEPIDTATVHQLEETCYRVRHKLLTLVYNIGLGHLGGELSMVEVAVAMYYRYLNFNVLDPHNPERDRFILSKGHCSETLYSIFSDLGAYSLEYMIENFECLDKSKFGMHTNRKYCPQIEVSAGSLGHGLPISVGMALAGRKQKADWGVNVLTGDGELEEGSNWEALMSAGHYQLGNLRLFVDRNMLQMTGPTATVMNIDPLDKKLEAFGWDVRVIEDGNDMMQVCKVLDGIPAPDSQTRRKPIAVIACTEKGHDVGFMAGNVKWHGGGIAKAQYEEAIASLEKNWKERQSKWQ